MPPPHTAPTTTAIQEAYTLFASPPQNLLPTTSLPRALSALNAPIPPPNSSSTSTPQITKRDILEAADPDETGWVTWEAFRGVAEVCLEAYGLWDGEGDGIREEGGGGWGRGKGKGRGRGKGKEKEKERVRTGEVEEAFGLFVAVDVKGVKGKGRITVDTLRRVARLLKEDVGEEVLRDMVLEANGGAGVGKGVGVGEFEGVMRRAGVWG